MTQLLEAHTLHKQFGDFVAVDGVSFRLNPGEIVGFLGPNGAGKTTTIKLLTGLLVPDAGRAMIAGVDIQREPLKAKARFAYVPDTPNLYGKESRDYVIPLPEEQATHTHIAPDLEATLDSIP